MKRIRAGGTGSTVRRSHLCERRTTPRVVATGAGRFHRARPDGRVVHDAINPAHIIDSIWPLAPARCLARTRSFLPSAPEEWAKCTGRATRGSAAMWRLKSCPTPSRPIRIGVLASSGRRRPSLRSRTPTSWPSSIPAFMRGNSSRLRNCSRGTRSGIDWQRLSARARRASLRAPERARGHAQSQTVLCRHAKR